MRAYLQFFSSLRTVFSGLILAISVPVVSADNSRVDESDLRAKAQALETNIAESERWLHLNNPELSAYEEIARQLRSPNEQQKAAKSTIRNFVEGEQTSAEDQQKKRELYGTLGTLLVPIVTLDLLQEKDVGVNWEKPLSFMVLSNKINIATVADHLINLKPAENADGVNPPSPLTLVEEIRKRESLLKESIQSQLSTNGIPIPDGLIEAIKIDYRRKLLLDLANLAVSSQTPAELKEARTELQRIKHKLDQAKPQ